MISSLSSRGVRGRRLKQRVLEHVRGHLKPGDRFFSERLLAEKFRVSRPTAGRLIAELVLQGVLERRAKGSAFVAVPEHREYRVGLVHHFSLEGKFRGPWAHISVPTISGILDELGQQNTLLKTIHADPRNPRSVVRPLLEMVRGMDGVLLDRDSVSRGLLDLLLEEGLHRRKPIALVDGEHPDVAWVRVDEADGVRRGVRYLASLGHRRMALFTGMAATYVGFQYRLDGYRAGLGEIGLPFDPALVLETDSNLDADPVAQMAARFAAWLATARPGFTALCCGSDYHAAGAVRALKSVGRDVPGEVSVMGFGNLEGATSPEITQLSTVEKPTYLISREAASQLVAYVRHWAHFPMSPSPIPFQKKLHSNLVIRGTTGPWKH